MLWQYVVIGAVYLGTACLLAWCVGEKLRDMNKRGGSHCGRD